MRLKKFLSLAVAIVSLAGASTGLYSKALGGNQTTNGQEEKDAVDGLILLQTAATTPNNLGNASNIENNDLNKKEKMTCTYGDCHTFLNLLNSVVKPRKNYSCDMSKREYIYIILKNYEESEFSIKCYDDFIRRLFTKLKIDKQDIDINEKDRKLFYSICESSLRLLNDSCDPAVRTGGQKRKRSEECSRKIDFEYIYGYLSLQHPFKCFCCSFKK